MLTEITHVIVDSKRASEILEAHVPNVAAGLLMKYMANEAPKVSLDKNVINHNAYNSFSLLSAKDREGVDIRSYMKGYEDLAMQLRCNTITQ